MTAEFLEELGISPEIAEKIIAASVQETENIRLEHAVREALKQKNPKNLEVALSLLDQSGLSLGADGVEGLSQRVESLMKEHAYLFAAEKPRIAATASGSTPAGISAAQFSKMGYRERVKLYHTDPELYQALTGK